MVDLKSDSVRGIMTDLNEVLKLVFDDIDASLGFRPQPTQVGGAAADTSTHNEGEDSTHTAHNMQLKAILDKYTHFQKGEYAEGSESKTSDERAGAKESLIEKTEAFRTAMRDLR